MPKSLLLIASFFVSAILLSSEIAARGVRKVPVEYYNVPERYDYFIGNDRTYQQLYHSIDGINQARVVKGFNGTVLVGYKGKIVYHKSFGYADRATLLPNDAAIPTQVASITKTFTGTAILWLADRGYLDVDDRVKKYLPSFPYESITLRMLLSHRSGMQEYMKFSETYWKNKSEMLTNQSVLNMLAVRKIPLAYTPNTRFKYCNTNYAMLALVIEQVTGVSYKSFVEDYIFEPLHMDNSFVLDAAKPIGMSYAKGYNANNTHYKNNYQDGVYGDKGIYTTAEDLYKWDQALYTGKFLSKTMLDEAYLPQSSSSISKNYGLGWRIFLHDNAKKTIYHTGWWHGYQGILSRHTEENFTVIVLSNRFINGVSNSAHDIYDASASILELPALQYD